MMSNPEVPSFIGKVETTIDALLIVYASKERIIPRIPRRLNDSQRRSMIKSGSVFVFWEQESRIERWTDGLQWFASRIVGNFLEYRERGGSDQGSFKTGGLIKRTITVIVQESGREPARFHVVSYYTSQDVQSGKLKRPSTRADIMNLYMPPHIFCLKAFRVPPKVEIGPDGKSRLVESEDLQPVDCNVEDSECSVPASPPRLSRDSLTSPVVNPFHESSLYPLSSGHTSASSGVYANGRAPDERWPGSNDSMLSLIQPQHQEMSWSPPAWPVLSSGHTMSRWQDNSVQSIHFQSGLPTHSVLQGTISALKHNQQIVRLSRIPGLQSLVGMVAAVQNILEVVNNNYANEEALSMLAQKASLFVLTLVGAVEQGSVSTFYDPNSMNSVIERLRLWQEMNSVLEALKMFQISFILQRDIARIETKMNQALKMLQQTTTAQRAFVRS